MSIDMREIDLSLVTAAVRDASIEACRLLPEDVESALKQGLQAEESPVGKEVLSQLIENAAIARTSHIPLCQDTGLALVFVELGQEVHVTGGSLYDAINEGVRQGYDRGYLRKSIVRHPLERVNTHDNTPAVIHLELVPGDAFKITIAPKGGGSENMSIARVLTPAEGYEGVKKTVLETVRNAGANPCPPIIVGVGLGGTIEKAALLSKKAILREIGSSAADSTDSKLESDLLQEINNMGIGPAGYGGRVTALAVHVESYPCHIASLPVAVTIQCHAARHKRVTL